MIEEPVQSTESKTDWLPVWWLISAITFIVFLVMGIVKIIPLKISIAILNFIVATGNFLTAFFASKKKPEEKNTRKVKRLRVVFTICGFVWLIAGFFWILNHLFFS